jgi:cell division protein FtsW (lipid II flippase)
MMGTLGRMLSPRNRELLGLVPSALLVTAGFTAIFIQAQNNTSQAATNVTFNHISSVSLSYGALFLALCLAAHLVIRFALPHADPYLFPLVAVLASVGIVMVYRIEPVLARQQAQWMVLGLVLFAATILALRKTGVGVLERYRYTIAAVGIGMTVLPRVPGIGEQVNGAYLDIHIGSVSFQPAELGKVAIVIFLASYLRDNRQILVTAGRRVLGLTIPPMKQFGPMLIVWGAAMVTLLLTDELGTSLMFYGAFLALLYVATGRLSFPLIGIVLFAIGAWYLTGHVSHVQARVQAWEQPFNEHLYYREVGGSYQLAQSLFAQADGGLLGTGFDRSLLQYPYELANHHIVHRSILPVPESDMIYAVIVDELGLVGAAALLGVYLMLIARGLKTAVLARDSFSKLLATGLSFVVAMQVFVIVGGVTRVIPLTGVTLPFVAYGGSSVVMNFVLVALLLVVSDRARRPYEGRARS